MTLSSRKSPNAPSDELELILAAQSGSIPARNKLIELYLPLARKIATQVAATNRIEAEDLVSAIIFGNTLSDGSFAKGGLTRAIETYDASRNVPFGVHARSWMLAAARREQERLSGNGRGPKAREDHSRARRAAASLVARNIEPTPERIAELLNVGKAGAGRISAVRVARALEKPARPVPLDEAFDLESDVPSPEQIVIKRERAAVAIRNLISEFAALQAASRNPKSNQRNRKSHETQV